MHTPLTSGILTLAAALVHVSGIFGRPHAVSSSDGLLVERIVGGSEVSGSDYGFAVRLDIETGQDSYLCGGTLISSSLVVTAAHCMVDANYNAVYQAKQVNVCYGSNTVTAQSCTTARNLTVHPQYNAEVYANDIALIQIEPVSGAKTASIYTGKLSEGDKITTMGWGKLSSTSDKLPTSLMSVGIEIGRTSRCQEAMPTYKSPNGPEMCSDTKLTPGKDSCQGDSGSPAVISDNGVAKLVGLTSSGVDLTNPGAVDCAPENGLAFYTHVAYFLDFIEQVSGQPQSAFTSGGGGGGSSSNSSGDSSTNGKGEEHDNNTSAAASIWHPRRLAGAGAAAVAAAGLLLAL